MIVRCGFGDTRGNSVKIGSGSSSGVVELRTYDGGDVRLVIVEMVVVMLVALMVTQEKNCPPAAHFGWLIGKNKAHTANDASS